MRKSGIAAFRFSAANALRELLRAELEVDDLTGAVDPRVAGAMWELRLAHDAEEALGEVRRRLAATQLFEALLEAGFTPDNNWDEAVDEVGEGRARVWRLYMAGSAANFEAGRTLVHQVLAVPATEDGRSGMPLRPVFE